MRYTRLLRKPAPPGRCPQTIDSRKAGYETSMTAQGGMVQGAWPTFSPAADYTFFPSSSPREYPFSQFSTTARATDPVLPQGKAPSDPTRDVTRSLVTSSQNGPESMIPKPFCLVW